MQVGIFLHDIKQKFFDDKQLEFVFYYLMLVSAGKVIIEKSRGEGSQMEQDTIENVS